jgi:Ca2+-binding RTX toxin-like protein
VDILAGGVGADTFVFDNRGVGGVNTISGFNDDDDQIEIGRSAFGADFNLGSLHGDDDLFSSSNPSARGNDDAFVYDTDDGRLFFDSNGQAAGGQTLIAVLQGGPQLDDEDFLIVAWLGKQPTSSRPAF